MRIYTVDELIAKKVKELTALENEAWKYYKKIQAVLYFAKLHEGKE